MRFRPCRASLLVPFAATAIAAALPPRLAAQELTLRLSREIESPYRRGIAPGVPSTDSAPRMIDSIGAQAPSLAPPAGTLRAPQPEERGALFLRADRLEGNADKLIDASGKVELRTRR